MGGVANTETGGPGQAVAVLCSVFGPDQVTVLAAGDLVATCPGCGHLTAGPVNGHRAYCHRCTQAGEHARLMARRTYRPRSAIPAPKRARGLSDAARVTANPKTRQRA